MGARGRDILYQFLVEAAVLSLLGGLIGVAAEVADGVCVCVGVCVAVAEAVCVCVVVCVAEAICLWSSS